MGTLTLNSFRQIGEIGDDNFFFEALDSAGAKHLFAVSPGSTWGFWKSNTNLAALGASNVSAAVVAQYSASYPSAGFVGEDVTNTSAPRVPLPVGVQVTNLYGPGNVPPNGIAFVPTFVGAIGFTTNAQGNNAGNLPTVLNAQTALAPSPYADYQFVPKSDPNQTLQTRAANLLQDLWTAIQNNPILLLFVVFMLYKVYQAATKKGDFVKNLLG